MLYDALVVLGVWVLWLLGDLIVKLVIEVIWIGSLHFWGIFIFGGQLDLLSVLVEFWSFVLPQIFYCWISEIGSVTQVVSPFGKKIRRLIYSKIGREDKDESIDVNCSLVNRKLSPVRKVLCWILEDQVPLKGSSLSWIYPSWDQIFLTFVHRIVVLKRESYCSLVLETFFS